MWVKDNQTSHLILKYYFLFKILNKLKEINEIDTWSVALRIVNPKIILFTFHFQCENSKFFLHHDKQIYLYLSFSLFRVF